ncbi:hypothetical protein [Flavobacterium sp.]|uniref:hypothetical protein n=1 Tax=Flavobacterium sp. TaxID=239 RepID=UPI00120C74F0|nr:hypothetical protein [Flavobacterium sp.]RZJ70513.1 MAG: hypothetical protein EOO49_13720 [Flavobacterium sp.]
MRDLIENKTFLNLMIVAGEPIKDACKDISLIHDRDYEYQIAWLKENDSNICARTIDKYVLDVHTVNQIFTQLSVNGTFFKTWAEITTMLSGTTNYSHYVDFALDNNSNTVTGWHKETEHSKTAHRFSAAFLRALWKKYKDITPGVDFAVFDFGGAVGKALGVVFNGTNYAVYDYTKQPALHPYEKSPI